MRLIKQNIHTEGITWPRGDTKVLLECCKYFTSERSEPTTALNLHWSDKGYIYYVTMVMLNFLVSHVKKIASFHAKAHLVRYFIGVSIINHISFLFDQPFLHLCLTRITVVV